MKKVLFTATVDSHILQFHIPYLKWFKEQGYEVHVATNGDEKIPYCDVKHKISFERSPIKINNMKAIFKLKKIIEKEKFDIIHCHTPMGSVVTRLAAKNARKKYKTRVIYTAHGFHFFEGAPLINWIVFYPIEKCLSKYTDCLITINEEDYNLAKAKFKAKKIELVNGVGVDKNKFDFQMSDTEKHELRQSLGLNDDDFVIIYVAELSKRKNQGMLIKAVKELIDEGKDNIKVILPGIDSRNGYYQEMTKKLEIEQNIKFLGYRKDIPKLLKISDLYVSTAKQEGLPVNIIEAMFSGLPIIATDCRGNRDLISDCIRINNYKLLKEKIIEKIINKQIPPIQCELESYKIQNLIKELIKIYKENFNMDKKVLIIPSCTDLNRGDQALVLETANVIKNVYKEKIDIYMMSDGETKQCEEYGLKSFRDILKHPSRFSKKHHNIKYSKTIIFKWGIVAIRDYIFSKLLLYKFTRNIIYRFLNKETKKSIDLYKQCDACYVKGGGFLHDYTGGLVGIYTMYYLTFHIRLALAMNKKVYIMPNSFGPFKSKINKKKLNKLLDKVKIVTARESISASGKTNGLDRDIPLYPDLAFFLSNSYDETKWQEFKKKYNLEDEKYVAVTVRPYRFYQYNNPEEKYKQYKNTFVKFSKFLKEKGYIPLFVVHTRAINDHENDELCIEEIIKEIHDKESYKVIKDDSLDCYDLKFIYKHCEYVIGTRFHSVIFAVQNKVPAIAITYGGNKGNGIMKDMNLDDYAIKIGELTFEKLKNKFVQLEKEKEQVIIKLDKYLKKCDEKYKNLIKELSKEN